MNETISFTTERNGYDREQVDRYIGKLSQAYQALYDGYTEVKTKHDSFVDGESLGFHDIAEINAEVISKALVSTEAVAQKIIADAHTEAAATRIELKRMTDDANSEVEKAQEAAKIIIDIANNEATEIVSQAKRNLETVSEIIAKSLKEAERRIENGYTAIRGIE